MKFIHFFPDDKFAKYIFKQFEGLQINNEYCVFSDMENLKFVNFQVKRITNNEINHSLVDYINSFNGLFIHYLGPEARKLLSFDNLTCKIFWIGWGGDYYWLINDLSSFELLKPLTYRKKLKIPYFFLTNKILKRLKKVYHAPKRKILKRIDFFSPVLKLEYDVIKKNYDVNFEYFDWNYGNLEEDLIFGNQNLYEDAESVLIGNSATYPNNFFDLFASLKKLNLNQEIYCPLNYGDKQHRKAIIEEGNLNFDQFRPIVDHLDYPSYFAILKKCRNVIMGHIRQQALGTILTLIYLGANVFLYKDSILFQYFHNIGIKLRSIEELLENPKLLNSRISIEELRIIRRILISKWGKDYSQKCGENLISLL